MESKVKKQNIDQKQMKLCFGSRLTPTEDNSTANEPIEASSSKDEVTITCKTKRNSVQQWLKTYSWLRFQKEIKSSDECEDTPAFMVCHICKEVKKKNSITKCAKITTFSTVH